MRRQKRPGRNVAAGRIFEVNAGMRGEIARRLRLASPAEIVRTAADDEMLLTEDASDQSAIGQFDRAMAFETDAGAKAVLVP